MRRRKTRRRLKSRSVLYISAIVALNFMGLGYAMWDDANNIDFLISTGSIDPKFDRGNAYVSGNGNINLLFDEENRILSIGGVFYPSSSIDINVGIENQGNVPIIEDDYTGNDDNGISSFSFENNGIILGIQAKTEPTSLFTYETKSYDEETQDYTVVIDESTIQDYQDTSYSSSILNCEAEIQSLESSIISTENRIKEIEKLIMRAESINEDYSFSYNIQYIQLQ